MQGKTYLLTTGPSPVPHKVMAAMTQPMIGHRGSEFAAIHRSLIEKSKKVFQTEADLFILTQSGTGGLETAVANTVSPGDKVLALVTGNFGERFAKIAATYGAEVDTIDFGWGNCVDIDMVEEALKKEPGYKAVLATHNETSTGVTNDIASLGKLVADKQTLLIVDAVSSMGGMDIKTDEWNVDIMVTGSQKCLMLPPGLALVSVSQKAWAVIGKNTSPAFYFSLPQARKAMEKNNTAWTPNVSLFFGLNAALDMILEEGLENVFARHAKMAAATREGIKALGLELLARDEYASNTLTAIKAPAGVDVDAMRKLLQNEYGVVFAGGQGKLKGKIFRIGHMGFVDKTDIVVALGALEMALLKMNYPVELGVGVAAAQRVFLNQVA